MSSPERQRESVGKEAQTPGWSKALFGSYFSTQKKARPVVPGTNPTPLTPRTPRARHHAMELDLTAPSEPNGHNILTNSGVDLLDTQVGVESSGNTPEEVPNHLSFSKSPWLKTSMPKNMNTTFMLDQGAPQFSVGNLKPPATYRASLSNRQAGVPPTAKHRRYRRSSLLVSKPRGTGPINRTHAANALLSHQGLFQPSMREMEARNNYTTIRTSRGKRLLGSAQVGGSRLPQNGNEFHDEQSPPSPKEEQATKRRKQVNFGPGLDVTPHKVKMITPVDSVMTTPAGAGRTATPFKKFPPVESVNEEDDSSMASTPPPVVPKRGSVPAPSSILAPTGSFNPLLSPTGKRPIEKLILEPKDFTFSQPSEAQPLGTPCAVRTPIFESSALFRQGKSQDRTIDRPPKFATTTAMADKKTTSSDATSKNSTEPLSTIESNQETGAMMTLAELFKNQRNMWKCNVCSTQNYEKDIECAACEAPRPGYEKEVAAKKLNQSANGSKGTIGTNGFSFGAAPVATAGTTAPGSIGSTGFSFGSAPAASGGSSGSGFSFGATPVTSVPAGSAGGFKFGTDSTMPSGTSTGNSGFTFGATVVPPPPAARDPKLVDSGKTTKTPAFKFGGTSTPTPSDSVRPSAPSFSFGSTTSEKKDVPKTNGFSFGTTPVTKSSEKKDVAKTNGFSFGAGPATVPIDKKEMTPNGFSFGAAPSTAPTGKKEETKNVGFSFGGVPAVAPAEKKEEMKNATFSFGAPSEKNAESKTNGFSFGAATSSAPLEKKEETTTFSFGAGPVPAPGGGDKKPFSFNVDAKPFTFNVGAKQSDSLPQTSFGLASEPEPTAIPPALKSAQPGETDTSSSSAHKALDTDGSARPSFSLGAPSSASSSFQFGAAPSLPSTNAFGTTAPAAGGTSSLDSADDDRSKRRRSRADDGPSIPIPSFGAPTTSAPSGAPTFSFGSSSAKAPAAPSSFGSQPSNDTASSAPSGFSFGAPSQPTPSAAPAPGPFLFGASTDKAPAPSSGFSFGGTPTVPPPGPSFSSGATGLAPAAPFFGATPSAPAPAAVTFGAPPAPAPAFGMPALAPAPSVGFSFGSTPAPAPLPPGGFGTTPAPAAPGGFGTTPAPAAPAFGSTPSQTFGSQPASIGAPTFGGAPAISGFAATPAVPFAAAPTSFGAPAPGGFGSTGGFGVAAPAPFGAPTGGFGAPAQQGGGFGGNFGAGPDLGGFGGGVPVGDGTPQFSLGTGGGGASRGGPGGRRIIKARRPRPR